MGNDGSSPRMLPLHPRHGIHAPLAGTPPRRSGSVRRTTSTDVLRPDGVGGPLVLDGRARDLQTNERGEPVLGAAASLRARVSARPYVLEDLVTDPEVGACALIGQATVSGFRAVVSEAVPEERAARSPLYQLLDEIPVATLVSGQVLAFAEEEARRRGTHRKLPRAPMPDPRATGMADQCAGWRTGATIMDHYERSGTSPVVRGPLAPALEDPDDPLGWHELAPLPPLAMRRRRRLDLHRADDVLLAEAVFRDTHVTSDGAELVIHEYATRAAFDPGSLTVLDIEADPRTLPWVECPEAAASARRLIGRTAHDLRAWVRAELVGTPSCTHLNDQLRALEDVVSLAALLDSSRH